MKIILLYLLLTLDVSVTAQTAPCGLPCEPSNILDVGLNVRGYNLVGKSLRHCDIPKDSIKNGFKLQLLDTSFKIKSFVVVYGSDENIQQQCFSGCEVTVQNADFLKSVQVGELLAIECVSIEKNYSSSLSTSLWIIVTK